MYLYCSVSNLSTFCVTNEMTRHLATISVQSVTHLDWYNFFFIEYHGIFSQ